MEDRGKNFVSRPLKPAHLPNEVLCKIFANLVGDCQTLGRCALVSLRFSQLVRRYTFQKISMTFQKGPTRIRNFFSLEQSFNENPSLAHLIQSFTLYFNFEGLRMQERTFRRINNLLEKLDHVHTLHLEQVGSQSFTTLFDITFLRDRNESSLRNVTLLWDYGLDTARDFMRLEDLESLSVQSLIGAQ
ncbi:MAG: hypothetical protein LQ342_002061 [Letrouitia transgressa]|nr:MAG: hypothetical protein LQ342_002061 [Letrouitia transgressa]